MRIWGNWVLFANLVWFAGLIGLGIEGYLKPRGRTVFDIYAVASQAWWTGEDLYPRQASTGELYRYSPLFAVLNLPFALAPAGVGNALWKVLNGLCFLVATRYWFRHALPESPPHSLQFGLFQLLLIPLAMLSLHIGQANLLMLGLLLFAVTDLVQERYWSAGILLAATTLIKVVPVALVLVLAVLFWRLILPFVTALFAGLLLPFLTQSPDYVFRQTQQWFGHLVQSGELNRERLRSLDKLFELVGVSLQPKLMLLLAEVAGGLVLLASLGDWWRTRDRRTTLWTALAWFLVWVLLFSPATETVTYSLAAPIIAVAILRTWATPGHWLRRFILIVSLILMGPINTDLGKPIRQVVDTTAAPIVGGLLLYACLIWEWRSIVPTMAGDVTRR